MGLSPAPPEFERGYSSPQPPRASRRPRLLALVAVVVVAGLAAGGAFLFLPDDDERAAPPPPTTAPTRPPSPSATPSTPPPAPTSRPPAPPPAQGPIAALTPPCAGVTEATARRLVPGARSQAAGNTSLTTCTFSSPHGDAKVVRVEKRLFPSGEGGDVSAFAREMLASAIRQAQTSPDQVITVQRRDDLGDDAFHRFKVDKPLRPGGRPETVVAEVTVRVRNALVTVGYSEAAPKTGDPARNEKTCVANAILVLEEVLPGLR
ncbi:hypothetical protein [Actinomadura flavalba]|uniref:hypothetical protein n=1 Tax=Actinomadura flavalba TaxID=1120938 RepID=UPI00039ECCAF|nr:hypothetical protein [Actinomadura flavalba]